MTFRQTVLLLIVSIDLAPAAFGQEAPQMQGLKDPQTDKMADAVTKAAQACESMMKMEMAAMPLKIGVLVIFGALVLVDLALLLVLEIQWIKYWSRRLKAQPTVQSAEGNR